MDGEHVVRSGSFAFEGINKSPIRHLKHFNGARTYEYETGNLTGMLVRRKFVGKMVVATFLQMSSYDS